MKNLAFYILSILAFFSCSKEDVVDTNIESPVGTSIIFETSDFDDINTRSVHETLIENVTILQFKDGVFVKKVLLEEVNFGAMITTKELVALPATVMKTDVNDSRYIDENGSENITVFVANAKDAFDTLTIDESKYSDFAAVKMPMVDYDTTKENISSLPMVGYYYDGIIEGASNIVNVSLQRTVAKVNFTVKLDNFLDDYGQPATVAVNSITLCNVPKNININRNVNRPERPANGANGLWNRGVMTPFPAYVAADFHTVEIDKNIAAAPLSQFTCYIPENVRGSFGEIKSNKDKMPEKIANTAMRDGLTYIFVDITFTDSKGVTSNATYKIYLGGNDSGDMNILRNTVYNVTTYLYGANDADSRITVNDLFNPTEENLEFADGVTPQPKANCYIINPTTDVSNFIIPLTFAREGWSMISSMEGVPSHLTDFDDLVKSKKWTIETVWRSWDGTDLNITGTPVSDGDIKYKNESNHGEASYFAKLDFSKLTNLSTLASSGNNALVALKDESGKIFWSWHLWFTDYNPYTTTVADMHGKLCDYGGAAFAPGGIYYGKKMMDRNIGATVVGLGDADQTFDVDNKLGVPDYSGLYYQWGRKDPFFGITTGPKQYDATGAEVPNHPSATSPDTHNQASAVNNPNTFYVGTNWTLNDYDLWASSGAKSPFDPSPAGWRVPKIDYCKDYNTTTCVSLGNGARLYKGSVLPGSNTVGATRPTKLSRMYFWSCTQSSSAGKAINQSGDTAGIWFNTGWSTGKSSAMPVRPVQE